MGRIAGQVSTTLRSFRHPGLDRVLQWDPRYADRVVARLLEQGGMMVPIDVESVYLRRPYGSWSRFR